MFYVGIYTITCLINKKIYVGHTENSGNRAAKHLNSLKINKHSIKDLQEDFNKYGEDLFLFEMIEECPKELLFSQEHYWCNLLNTHDPKYGYNTQLTNPYGIGKHSETTRIKRSKSLSKPVIQLSSEGKFIKEFESIKEASKELNIKDSNIVSVLKNRYKLCKKYKFVYKKDYNYDS